MAAAGVAMCASVCCIMLCIIKYQYSRSALRGSIIVYIYNLYLVCHYLIGEKLRAPILKLHSDIEMLLLFLRAALCGLGRAAVCGAAEQLIRHIRHLLAVEWLGWDIVWGHQLDPSMVVMSLPQLSIRR